MDMLGKAWYNFNPVNMHWHTFSESHLGPKCSLIFPFFIYNLWGFGKVKKLINSMVDGLKFINSTWQIDLNELVLHGRYIKVN